MPPQITFQILDPLRWVLVQSESVDLRILLSQSDELTIYTLLPLHRAFHIAIDVKAIVIQIAIISLLTTSYEHMYEGIQSAQRTMCFRIVNFTQPEVKHNTKQTTLIFILLYVNCKTHELSVSNESLPDLVATSIVAALQTRVYNTCIPHVPPILANSNHRFYYKLFISRLLKTIIIVRLLFSTLFIQPLILTEKSLKVFFVVSTRGNRERKPMSLFTKQTITTAKNTTDLQ